MLPQLSGLESIPGRLILTVLWRYSLMETIVLADVVSLRVNGIPLSWFEVGLVCVDPTWTWTDDLIIHI
jgi:hypothetical protein